MNLSNPTPTTNKNTNRWGRLVCFARSSAAISIRIIFQYGTRSYQPLSPQGCQGLPLAHYAAPRWVATAHGREAACLRTETYEHNEPGAKERSDACPWQPQAGWGKQLTKTAGYPTRMSVVGHPGGQSLASGQLIRSVVLIAAISSTKTLSPDRARTCRAEDFGRYDIRRSVSIPTFVYGFTSTISSMAMVTPSYTACRSVLSSSTERDRSIMSSCTWLVVVSVEMACTMATIGRQSLGGTARAQATTAPTSRLPRQLVLRLSRRGTSVCHGYARLDELSKYALGIVDLADDPVLVHYSLACDLTSDHAQASILLSHVFRIALTINGVRVLSLMDSVALQPSLPLPCLPMPDNSTSATKADLAALESKFDSKLDTVTSDLKRHFEVVAEALKHDVLGAMRDFTSLMQDRHLDHEQRIRHLERTSA